MADRLWAVANATGSDATLLSSENPDDKKAIPKHTVSHTGGSGGDFIYIPHCSDSTYYQAHHILIGADDGTWKAGVWSDDQNDLILEWSPDDAYSGGHFEWGSKPFRDITLLIDLDSAGHPVVHWGAW
jgi:hypothetical protein